MLGVFDSGIGGLTVVKEIKKLHPQQRLVYFGDVARVPYGNRSQQTVQLYCRQITEFFLEKGIREIVIACNTASAQAGDHLRLNYPQVLFHDVITPVVQRIKKEAAEKNKYKVALIGTKGTILSRIYEKMIASSSPNVEVYSKACPLFVPLAEENWCQGEIARRIAEEYLNDLAKKEVNSLVLGCTHYPLLKKVIAPIMGPQVEIISSAREIARNLPQRSSDKDSGKDQYYFSDLTEGYENLAKQIVGADLRIRIKTLG